MEIRESWARQWKEREEQAAATERIRRIAEAIRADWEHEQNQRLLEEQMRQQAEQEAELQRREQVYLDAIKGGYTYRFGEPVDTNAVPTLQPTLQPEEQRRNGAFDAIQGNENSQTAND